MAPPLFDHPRSKPESSPATESGDRPKLRVGVVGSTYPRFHEDPLVPWLRESVGRLARRGHDMTVIAPSSAGLASHSIDGVPVHRFRYGTPGVENLTHDEGAPSKVGRNPLYKLLGAPYIVSGAAHVAYWAARNRMDLLHVHWPFPHALLASLSIVLRRTPWIATCHGAELAMARRSPGVAHILRQSLLEANAVSCNSSHTQAEIERLCGRTASIIPYGSTVRPARAPRDDAPHDEAQLLFSGRLIARKGVDYLLRALPLVLQHRPVRLRITGEGDRRGEWEALAKRLGLEERVEFLGFVSTERLGELYRTSDVYVHPAIYDDNDDTEGLGVVLSDALASECPVVASSVGGIVDVIRHEQTGLLVSQRDERALADAILRMLGDPPLARRLGKAGRVFAEQHFDWERITTETEDLYYRVLDGEPPPASIRRTLESTTL
jgi:glycosyltransferase involved in cell wall biosynthesis